MLSILWFCGSVLVPLVLLPGSLYIVGQLCAFMFTHCKDVVVEL